MGYSSGSSIQARAARLGFRVEIGFVIASGYSGYTCALSSGYDWNDANGTRLERTSRAGSRSQIGGSVHSHAARLKDRARGHSSNKDRRSFGTGLYRRSRERSRGDTRVVSSRFRSLGVYVSGLTYVREFCCNGTGGGGCSVTCSVGGYDIEYGFIYLVVLLYSRYSKGRYVRASTNANYGYGRRRLWQRNRESYNGDVF